jgi:hypothetical protein
VPATDAPSERRVRTAHHLPGRTRLRLAPAPITDEEARAVVESLPKLAGVRTVTVDRTAASVLVLHEPQLEPAQLEQAVRVAINSTGKRLPSSTISSVASALVRVFHDLNRDVLAATDGRLDAATLASFGFMGAGALQVALDGQIRPPPWFNLAWWGFRTFVSLEEEVIRTCEDDVDNSD